MQTYLDNLLAAMLEENKRLATCVTTMKSLVDEAKIDYQINNTENSDNMKHSTEQKPEAHRLAEKLRDAINLIELGFSDAIATNDLSLAAMEIESLHARVQELEAKEAKPAAPVVLPEPVMAQVRYIASQSTKWSNCTVENADAMVGGAYEVRYLYTEQQVRELLATPNNLPAQAVERSATHGMSLHQRILHVGGRENAQTYIEFGSVAAVRALVDQVLRDLPDSAHGFAMPAPQPQADALDAERYRWLRDQGSLAEGSRHPQSWRCVAMLADMGGEHADAAIDAAIQAAKEK